MQAARPKLVSIVGTRPQFIKAMPLSIALSKQDRFEHLTIHTGQHFDANMSDVFFGELGMATPHYQLGIHGGSHGEMTGRMLAGIERVLIDEKPSAVVVYGDTNSTLAGALAAAKLHIPVAHVEAGMRSGNWMMPEEINRIVADRLSQVFFCPTSAAVENLRKENVTQSVHHVGDLMYDTFLLAGSWPGKSAAYPIANLSLEPGNYAVATLHRAENTGDREMLSRVLEYLVTESRVCRIVLPVHPRLREALKNVGASLPPSIAPIEPLGYLEMYDLLTKAAAVFTDSGGLQKEAYFHRVPCVTLRSETEWTETIGCGWNRLWTQPAYQPRQEIEEYGDGHAAGKIAERLAATFC